MRKRYNVQVEWFDADNITGGNDSGGIFVDKKTGRKMFFLRTANVGLNPNNVPWRLIDNVRKVYLLRYGLKNFRFINMNIGEGQTFEAEVTEEDVNWAVVDYERQNRIFSKDKLMELIPYIALTFVGIVILIMVIFVVNKFEVLKDIATVLKETATIIANANAGTQIIE